MEETTKIEIMKLAAKMVDDSIRLRKECSVNINSENGNKYHDLFDQNVECLKKNLDKLDT